MPKRETPEINAGSMADIAFLLLIFFLVTTTMAKDEGINRKLPPWQPEEDNSDLPPIKEKNIFTVMINGENKLLVEENVMRLSELRAAAKAFIVNNGDGTCTYCDGAKDPKSSDNPNKAVISLQNNRLTNYESYIAVQNELVAAYNDLRNDYAERTYGKKFIELEGDQMKEIQKMFPSKISEAEPVR